MELSKETELRHLPAQYQLQLSKLLDMDDSILSLLMGNIVKNLEDPNSELRFISSDIDALRSHADKHRKSSTLVLLDEWSTMGRHRPKIKHFLEVLIKCELFQAADYVADIIKETRPTRPLTGPASLVDISISDDDEIQEIMRNLDYPFSSHVDNKITINQIQDTSKNEQQTQSTQAASQIFSNHQQQPIVSDLIKFSVVTSAAANTSANNFDIPMTVNSSNSISSNNNIPALSLIYANNNESQTLSNFIPSISTLQSNGNAASSSRPDFSNLINGGQSIISVTGTEDDDDSSSISSNTQ